MAIQTVTQRNNMCTRYAADCAYMAVYSTVPSGGVAGTELSGGSPAYARKASNWGTPSNSAVVASPAAFDIPSGATAAGIGFHTAVTAGTFLDGVGVTSQTFASQGTLTVTATFTEV
jgi:hypothetical protein